MKLEANIKLECLQAQHGKYPWKIVQKLLEDNDFAMKVTITLVIAEVIDHLATILKGKQGQILNYMKLGNLTNKHFQGNENKVLKQTSTIVMAEYTSIYSQYKPNSIHAKLCLPKSIC